MTTPEPACRRILPVLFTASAMLAMTVPVGAQDPTPLKVPADQLMKVADAHDVNLEAEEALECYLVIEKAEPENADVLVRIARQYRHLMADASTDEDKMRLGNTAISYGKRAAEMGPKNSDAQLSCAISYGKMLPLMSKKEQVQSSKLIKEGAERAVHLNAKNDLAWNILGRWHRAVAGMGTVTRTLAAMIYDKLPPASNEESVSCLEKAIEINPSRLMHYVELGKTYAQMGREEEARKYLEKGLSMPSKEKDDPAMKIAARETLAELQ